MRRVVLLAPAGHHETAVRRGLYGEDIDLDVVSLAEDQPLPDWSDHRPGATDLLLGNPKIYVEDEDASDDEEFVQAVRDLEPRVFMLETVRGLAGPRYEAFLHDLADDLADRGYRVGWDLVTVGPAKRVLIVGIRENLGAMPFIGRYVADTIRENLRRVS